MPSRFWRLSCCGVVFTSLAIDEFLVWSAMASKLRKGVLGSRARSEQKEFWQMRSRLMGERSGRANSVWSRMCGRCGVAGDVTTTSQRGYTRSIGRRLLQSQESGLQALRRRVGRKTEKRDAWNVKIRSSEQGLLPWKRRKEDKRCQETRGEIAWKSRTRPSVAKNWMNRGKNLCFQRNAGEPQGVTTAPDARSGKKEERSHA